ncbi:MAG: metallophosphoesterase [Lachnospiraceae bacterium]
MAVKTLCISDIHVDINRSYPVMEALAQYAIQKKAECILIAGDICEDVYKVREHVQWLKKQTGVQVYYVPGNHDLWHTKESNVTTDEIYKLYCEDENCLCGKQVRVGKHIVLGDVGWYDYSFGSSEYTRKQYDGMEHGGRVWQDKYYNDWTGDNTGRNEWFLERLKGQLEKAAEYMKQENDGEIQGIAVVTHMLPHRGFTVPVDDKPIWKFFNAFLGSGALGELCEQYHVDYALCGHVHYRHEFTEKGIRYMCRCLNYASEWWGSKEIQTQIEQAAGFIEL